ncbi:MAG: 1-acyl-sn-glycerol-3-phosphate acyltransferase [Deltaproteobacteria bacterium]|nr:1-acyl-sn-glycerol-3-phosphate acyltransferase [Deltaproteobacteria bacterium]
MNYLTTQSNYQSPAGKGFWLARNAPTPMFYRKMLWIVYKGWRMAKKGTYSAEHWIQSSLGMLQALESVGVQFDIRNMASYRELPSACVYVGNHMSILETFILPCLIRPYRRVTFVVKESLIEYPFFGPILQTRKPVVVGRANPREDLKTVLEEGQVILNQNISIVLFPQTTRSVQFDENKFNTLGVKLARRADVPVIPVAIKSDAWGLGRKLKDFGKIYPRKRVHICFGDALHVSGTGKEEHRQIIEFISQKLKAWS